MDFTFERDSREGEKTVSVRGERERRPREEKERKEKYVCPEFRFI